MKNKEINLEKPYAVFNKTIFTVIVVSVVSIPIIWGYSIWGVGLGILALGIFQLILGISAFIRPSLFRLKSARPLNLWLVLTIFDLVIFASAILFKMVNEWPEIILATMLIGLILSIIQFNVLTSKKFKY